jgi:hypothetical protein
MGLKGDFSEVEAIWSRSPWRVKAFLGISLFLASGSIASLSDTVFRWKGFVLDAVTFYRTYISGQLLGLLHFSFDHVPEGVPHLLILSALFLAANLRVAYFALPTSHTRWLASRVTAQYLGVTAALLYGTHNVGRELEGASVLSLFAASALCASWSYWRTGGAARILWFVNLFTPFILVGIAAAIVSGWERVA